MLPLRGELPAERMPHATVQWLESRSLIRRSQAPTHEPAIHRARRLLVRRKQQRHCSGQRPYVLPKQPCGALRQRDPVIAPVLLMLRPELHPSIRQAVECDILTPELENCADALAG